MTTPKPCPDCGGTDFEPPTDILLRDYKVCSKCHSLLYTGYEKVSRQTTRPSPWRKWPEERPEIEQKCFVRVELPNAHTIPLARYAQYSFFGENSFVSVTHWMPIPELPESNPYVEALKQQDLNPGSKGRVITEPLRYGQEEKK
jgi:hypothetical protein